MSKPAKIILAALGLVLLVAGGLLLWPHLAGGPQASSIGTIGGANGPTAIFIASSSPILQFLLGHLQPLLAGVALLAGGVVLLVLFWVRNR